MCELSVTVIMPVYNSRQFLPIAMASLLSEKDSALELTLVDDGSTDDSSIVCDGAALLDSRVVVVHKRNGGMCQARNMGLDEARGKYVMFCDNDDWVLPGFVTDNLLVAERYDADCVRFGCRQVRVGQDGRIQKDTVVRPSKEIILSGQGLPRGVFEAHYGMEAVWVALYRRSVIHKYHLRFDESFRSGFEDHLFNDMFSEHSQSTVFIPKEYYVWIQRVSRSTSTKVSENLFTSLSKLMKYEYCLMIRTDMLQNRPAECARRFMSYIRVPLTANRRGNAVSIVDETRLYERCRQLVEPYADLLCGKDADLPTRVLASALLHRRYSALFALIRMGICAKSIYFSARLLFLRRERLELDY